MAVKEVVALWKGVHVYIKVTRLVHAQKPKNYIMVHLRSTDPQTLFCSNKTRKFN